MNSFSYQVMVILRLLFLVCLIAYVYFCFLIGFSKLVIIFFVCVFMLIGCWLSNGNTK